MTVHAVKVDWSTHQSKLRDIRERVFIIEQRVPRDLEWDGRDDKADHFLALNQAGIALGTARLLPTGQIGRMAVLPEHRNRGIGRKLLDAAVAQAIHRGFGRVFLHAQRSAEGFYRKAGFTPDGDEFVEADIPHIAMMMALPIPFEPTEVASTEIVNPIVSPAANRPNRLTPFDSEHDGRAAIARLVDSGRRTIVLFSPDLDAALFATEPSLTALSEFARRRHSHLQVLVEDAKGVAASSHPLLELARRLPSKILIKRMPADRAPSRASYLIVDEEAVWLQPDRDAYVGWSNSHDRVAARRLLDEFTMLFERSSDDPELRLLNL